MIGRLAGGPTRVALLEGAGHMPHREQPAQVLALTVAGMAGPCLAAN